MKAIGWMRFNTVNGGEMVGQIAINHEMTTLKGFLNTAEFQTAKSPDWMLYANFEKIGVLWEKTSKKGQTFMSGFLDHPKVSIVCFEERNSADLWTLYEGDR